MLRIQQGRYGVSVPALHQIPRRIQAQYACMTRSSTKEIFTPFENSEREFRSSRKLFKTPSLDELSSPKIDLFSDLEENSKEEVAKTMAKTMEQYMSKNRADYGSAVTRPNFDDKDHFELKGQFLKELRDNTFSGSNHEDVNEHIEKVLEIVDLFHIPNITQDQINNFQQEPDETLYQAWERFKELLMKFPQHYLTEMQEVILFYNGLEVPTRQILDSKGAIPTKTAADAKGGKYIAAAPGFYKRNNVNPSYQERRQSMEESLSKVMNESAKRHEENSNLIKEIRASIDAAIRN
ncbi:hypothetical protein Tco_0596558 [Tanacetum coccineum]